jgi:hypothetical protein
MDESDFVAVNRIGGGRRKRLGDVASATAVSSMREGQVEDDHVFFFFLNYRSGMVALDQFWSWARLAPGPVLGCGGQVSYFSIFFCFFLFYFLSCYF